MSTSRSPPATTPRSARSTPLRSRPATRTTAAPGNAPSTTPATTARSSWTPTGTTSRSSTTTSERRRVLAAADELRARAREKQEPGHEQRDADDRREGEDRPDHARTLVVARRPAHEDPEPIEPLEQHEPSEQRREHSQPGGHDPETRRLGLRLHLRADPEAPGGDRPPEPERDEHHDREERRGEEPVERTLHPEAGVGRIPIADRPRAGAPADEETAVVGRIGAHGPGRAYSPGQSGPFAAGHPGARHPHGDTRRSRPGLPRRGTRRGGRGRGHGAARGRPGQVRRGQ